MKALVLEENGNLNSLKIVHDRQIPEPKANEIQVRVHASGLNPSDYQTAMYKGINDIRKRVLGLEISGVVTKIGDKVRKFKVGDRVYYLRDLMNLDGGFGEYAVTVAHAASLLPEAIPFYVAAAIPAAGFTAYQSIVQKLRPKSGKTILIEGGSGGVGSYAIQLAKIHGLKVITTCKEKNKEYTYQLGANEVIAYDKVDVYKWVDEFTRGKGVPYILNAVSGDTATKDLDILAINGEIAVLAGFPDFSKIRFFEKGISIYEIALSLPFQSNDIEGQCEIAAIGDEFAKLMEKQMIRPPHITIIHLEDIPEYLIKMRNGEITGKVVAQLI